MSSFLGGFMKGFTETFLERERLMREPPDLKALQNKSPSEELEDLLRSSGLGRIREIDSIGGSYVNGATFDFDGIRLNDKTKPNLKCSYCLNQFNQKYEQCPTCGGREFIQCL